MTEAKPLNSRALTTLVIESIEAMKGENIVELDVRTLTDVTDYMIVASGRSKRQVMAIAENVVQAAKRSGSPALGTEGEKSGDWVLVDLVDVIVHIMEPEVREYYQLEKLWTGHAHPGELHSNA